MAQDIIHIWEDTEVHKPKVTLEPYLPAASGHLQSAIIICPGGSYCWLDYPNEGRAVAQWLQSIGIAAFVLRYRVAGFWAFLTHYRLFVRGNQYPDMLCDAQRSIQIVRLRAAEWKIDPAKIGIMGFSAGGHLAMLSGIYHKTNHLKPLGIETQTSLRPDFIAAIYPVVTMSQEPTHRRSRRGALGEYKKFSQPLRDHLSIEKHIASDTPPVFLMNCKDDPIVDYRNSELLEQALKQKSIPHTYTQYNTGGHGFGASPTKGTAESRQWRKAFQEWHNTLFKENTQTE